VSHGGDVRVGAGLRAGRRGRCGRYG